MQSSQASWSPETTTRVGSSSPALGSLMSTLYFSMMFLMLLPPLPMIMLCTLASMLTSILTMLSYWPTILRISFLAASAFLKSSDSDLLLAVPLLLGQLDVHLEVVPQLRDHSSFPANDLGVVLRSHTDPHHKAVPDFLFLLCLKFRQLLSQANLGGFNI